MNFLKACLVASSQISPCFSNQIYLWVVSLALEYSLEYGCGCCGIKNRVRGFKL
jgi:hypothetical protein